MALVEALAKQRFDHRLAADIEVFGSVVEFLQHRSRKIHVHPLDRFPHFPRVAKKARNIPALVSHPSDRLGRHWLFLKSRILHRVFAPPQSPSIGLQDGRFDFSFGILTNLENDRVKTIAHPADGALLNWQIKAFIAVVGMKENLLCLFEADATLRFSPKAPAFPYIEMKSHDV
jgi:hypothetical protein